MFDFIASVIKFIAVATIATIVLVPLGLIFGIAGPEAVWAFIVSGEAFSTFVLVLVGVPLFFLFGAFLIITGQ